MDSISSVSSAFGYTNSVLAYDDTLPTPATTTAPSTSPTSPTSPTPPASTSGSATTVPTPAIVETSAQKAALGDLAAESQVLTAMFAASPSTASSSVFFSGGAMQGLLKSQGSAALAYLTPQGAPSIGSLVNTTG